MAEAVLVLAVVGLVAVSLGMQWLMRRMHRRTCVENQAKEIGHHTHHV